MARTYTPEQLAAINTTDRTLLLSAAAGSGKTATLTERLIRMITHPEHPLDVSRMLIVTFTRAAAKELRDRISAALSAAIEKDPANKRLAKQALLLPSAKIRTIDAFCNDLVRGHTDAIGITPFYRIPDGAEADLLAMEIIDDLIEEAYRGDYAAEGLDVSLLSESLSSVKNERKLGEKLFRFYREKVTNYAYGIALLREAVEDLARGKALPFFETRIGDTYRKAVAEELTERAKILRALGERAFAVESEKDGTALRVSATELADYFDGVRAAMAGGFDAFVAALAQEPPKAKSTTRGGTLSVEGNRCKSFRTGCLDTRRDLLKRVSVWDEAGLHRLFDETHKIALSLALLLDEFDRRYAAAKRERGLCEYSDLSHFAYRLLLDEAGNKTPLAERLTEAFDVVSIDEYQDVNEIQHKIFEAISSPTNRFMVGDIKQSIYGFRGAEPSIFAELRKRFPPLAESTGNEAVLYLTHNFRSSDGILELANGVFDFLFGVVGDSIGYTAADRLNPPPPPTEGAPPRPPRPVTPTPTLYLLPGAKDEDDEDEESPDEMAFVAKLVRRLLREGRLADGSPVKPSDIAILTRKNKTKHRALLALTEAGIPSFYEEEEDFFAHSDVLLALCLCHAVNNPRRDIYLAGLLRSPLYGFTMDDLVRIRREGGATLYDSLVAYTEKNGLSKGHAFLAELADFRLRAEGERTDRLLCYMFDKTAIWATLDEDGRDRVHRFCELARKRESLSFQGLYSFLSYINDLIDVGKGKGGEKTGKGTKEDGVYVDTVHGTKGLEFPICILAGCGARLSTDPPDRTPINYLTDVGFASPVSSHDGMGRIGSLLYSALGGCRKRREMEEEIRVLYVALTRPKEQLYITAAMGKKQDTESFLEGARLLKDFPSAYMLYARCSYAAWIVAALEGDPSRLTVKDLSRDPALIITETATDGVTAKSTEVDDGAKDTETESAERAAEVAAAYARYKERFSFVYPHAAEASLPGKLSVSRLYPGYLDESDGEGAPLTEEERLSLTEKEDGRPFTPAAPFYLSGVEESAAAKAGTATHLFLQFCDFSSILQTGGSKSEIIDKELARLVARGFMAEKDAERVRREELAVFADSPLAEEIASAARLHREMRFNTYLPASLFAERDKEKYEGLEIFVQGVIDLLVEREDGSLLLVDYKTDRLPTEALSDENAARAFLFERHLTQLRYYREAVFRIFGKTPTLALYSLHAGKVLLE